MRRGRSTALLALSIAGLGLATGCRSVTTQPPPFMEDGGVFVASETLGDEARARSLAHAAYATGIHHEVAEEPARAEEFYRRALAIDPGNETYALRVACAMSQQKDIRGGIEFAERFVTEHPASPQIERWLAEVYRTTREWDAAIRHAQAAAELEPREARNWAQWALAVHSSAPNDPSAEREILLRGTENAADSKLLRRMLLKNLSTELEQEPGHSARAEELRLQLLEQARILAQAEPGDPGIHRIVAVLAFSLGFHEEGLKALERHLALVGDDELDEPFAVMAAGMTPPLQIENLLKTLESLRERGEAPPQGWLLQARCLAELGREDEVRVAMEHALEETPGDEDAWLWYLSFFDDDEAPTVFRHLRRALKANPDSGRLHALNGVAAFHLHRYALAESECLKARELLFGESAATELPQLDLILASAQTKIGHHEAAARTLRDACLARGADLLEAFATDLFFSSSANFRLAAKTLREFIGQTAGDPGLADAGHACLAIAYMAHDQPKNAVKEFDVLCSHYPSPRSIPARLAFMRAVALDSVGRKGEACEQLEILIRNHPDYPDPCNTLAYLWAEADMRLEEALPLAETAVGHEPGNPAYLDTLAWVQYKLGRLEEAQDNILLALEGAPGEEVIAEHARIIGEAVRAATSSGNDGGETPREGE